jgi:DNA-binding MarR family transcriptional regulator
LRKNSPKQSAKARRTGALRPSASEERPGHHWTFLSNHAHVLICLAEDPEVRLREIADRIGITERAVMKIVADLDEEGLVHRHREGRRNSYELTLNRPLRHPIENHRKVGELVNLFLDGTRPRERLELP